MFFVFDVSTLWNDLLPRSPLIGVALLFHGLDQMSPDLCCPQITRPSRGGLTSVPLQLDHALLQGRTGRFCGPPQTLGCDSCPEAQLPQKVVGSSLHKGQLHLRCLISRSLCLSSSPPLKKRGCCENWKVMARVCFHWGEWLPALGHSAMNSGCLSLVLPVRFCRKQARRWGNFGMQATSSLILLPHLSEGAGLSHLLLEEQHRWCLPSSSACHPQSREDQRLWPGGEGPETPPPSTSLLRNSA